MMIRTSSGVRSTKWFRADAQLPETESFRLLYHCKSPNNKQIFAFSSLVRPATRPHLMDEFFCNPRFKRKCVYPPRHLVSRSFFSHLQYRCSVANVHVPSVHQNVLRLDVSVNDAMLVQEPHGRQELL